MNPYLHDLLTVATIANANPEAWNDIIDFDELRCIIECEIAEVFNDPMDEVSASGPQLVPPKAQA